MNGENFLIISKNTEAALSYIKSATELLRSRGCNVFCLSEKASFFDGLDIAPISSDKLNHINIALVFGGDGTILKAGRLLIPYKIPILGINMGTLGYLTDSEPSSCLESVKNYLDGKYTTEKRCTLSVNYNGNRYSAINEAVVYRGSLSHIMTICVEINDQHIETLRADGIIVSTPTGSTAYNLSAGGPIIAPFADAFVLTPICAHSLTARPIVLSDSSTVSITVHDFRTNEKPSLDIDGKTLKRISEGSKITIKVANEKLFLIHTKPTDFFRTLQSKLLIK